ncbi:hypothetical protein KMT30_07385, partial [Streptomyces sp. IBSBF 2953]|nr:hypothetical protein [Streptomyces hayashii]
STTDVNETFARERRALIQSAGARRRGRSRRWPRTCRRRGEVIGRDGLDTSRGTAALYTSTPAWHGLGTVI